MNSKLPRIPVRDVIRELMEIETELDRKIQTTLWISDPHGAGDRFVSILKGRFGLVWQSCREALPDSFSAEKLVYLDRIIRKERYFEFPGIALDRREVIHALVTIIRSKMQDAKDFDTIRMSISQDLKPVLENLVLDFPVPDMIFNNVPVADRIITALPKVVKQVILGYLVVLGDVFDRGDEPDKILRILSSPEIKPHVQFIWGNHDILWMGAAAGSRSLIAEALRITVRYDNMDFLKRLDLDISRLRDFACEMYPEEVGGNFKAKLAVSRKMEKTLAMIQFKLEEETIRLHPEFEMQSRLILPRLGNMLKKGDTSALNDGYFPTIDPDNPEKLTDREREIIDDLVQQFTTSRPVKRLMEFLFTDGKMYHINNYILNIHALVPSTADGKLDSFLGRSGLELFDHIDQRVKETGRRYLAGEQQDPDDLALMFYLWCGPKSPFFGKHAMKTFERYFCVDRAEHEEKSMHWGDNLRSREFMDLLLEEFGAERVVYGHTPVDVKKGEKLASADGRAINIDGGFSDAYLARGHSLIMTPYSLYAIILPSTDEILEARDKNEPAELVVEQIDSFSEPMKIRDTYRGKQLLRRREDLLRMLAEG